MRRLPFYVRRPWLIVKGTFTNREAPDLAALRAIDDPEEFIWAVLPHAARSFATSILVLPRRDSWAAAIAYLLCRALDTYEDLHPDESDRPALLREFGHRYETGAPALPIAPDLATTDRDRLHLLLIERIELIDAGYATLDGEEQASIAELVRSMAEGMAWATETFAAQGGVLVSREQRAKYCHHVIGEPARYAMRSLLHVPVTPQRDDDALRVAELIQLANITRDIERDLARGVAYHDLLRPDLGATGLDPTSRDRVRQVRDEMMREALPGVDSYARLVAELPTGISQARGAAVLMLSFTDRYYSGCARKAGRAGWRRTPRFAIYANSILATLSSRWAHRIVARTVHRFHGFLTAPPNG